MSIFRLGINRCLTLTQPFSSVSRVRKQRQCPDFSMSGVRCPLRTLSLASLPFVCLTLCPITSHSPCQSALAGDLALKRDASGEGSGGREGDRTGWGLPHTQGSRRWRGAGGKEPEGSWGSDLLPLRFRLKAGQVSGYLPGPHSWLLMPSSNCRKIPAFFPIQTKR